MRRPIAALAALLAAAALAGCGRSSPGPARTRVLAATSLQQAFPRIVPAKRARYSFAGSDALAFQIRRGAPADVFAAANAQYPQELARARLCDEPVTFATNVLVIAVPRGNPAGIHSLDDLARGRRRRIAVGQPTVPVGQYTRALLRRLSRSDVLTRNTVSSEPDVAGVIGKVALGSADAGFVYRSDQHAARAKTTALQLPRDAQPPIRYQACRVRRSGANAAGAQRFIRAVTGRRGRSILRASGFGLPPLRP